MSTEERRHFLEMQREVETAVKMGNRDPEALVAFLKKLNKTPWGRKMLIQAKGCENER